LRETSRRSLFAFRPAGRFPPAQALRDRIADTLRPNDHIWNQYAADCRWEWWNQPEVARCASKFLAARESDLKSIIRPMHLQRCFAVPGQLQGLPVSDVSQQSLISRIPNSPRTTDAVIGAIRDFVKNS
jgi:hypothetical protein